MSNFAKFLMLLCIALLLAAGSIWFIGGKKKEYDTTAIVNAQASQVFPYVVDPELKKKWLQGLVEQEVLGSTAIKEDAQMRSVYESNGQTIEFNDEVIRFAENEIITIKSTSGSLNSTWMIRLREIGGKTEVTYRRLVRFNGLERFKSIFSENEFQREIENDIARLIQLVESENSDSDDGEPDVKDSDGEVELPESSSGSGDDESADS